MPLSREQLIAVKEDLIRFIEADSEVPELSDQGKRTVMELVQSGPESAFLRGLDENDSELAEVARGVMLRVEAIRADAPNLGPRITKVGYSPMLQVKSGDLVVCLRLSGQDVTFEIAQDLEDTLWVGTAIVEAVQESMESMARALSAAMARKSVGTQFADYLGKLEMATAEIRRIHDQFSKN